jgi:uncharacterized protein (TIGR03083 family)
VTQVIDSLEADRAVLLKLCSALSDADWSAESGCAGWTVQDVVAHLGALFWLVVDASKLPDVTGLPTERAQDAYVEQRRSLSAAEVLADYESVSAAALPALASLSEADFELPLGDLGTYHVSVVPTAYSFDHYVHIRYDLFAPRGPLAGEPPPSGESRLAPVLDWIAAALPQQNAEVLAGLPGSIEFSIDGPGARTIEAGSGEPVLRVSLDAQTFVRAVTQRGGWDEARIVASDDELGSATLRRLKVF